MINKKKKVIEVFLVGILAIMLCSFVSAAVAISTDYFNENPATIAPGETKEIVFGRLQNTENKEAILKIELLEGMELGGLTNENLDSFVVPAKARGVELKFKASAPEKAVENYRYTVTIKYTEITPSDEEGMIVFTQSQTVSMPIVIKSHEEKPANVWMWMTIILIIALIILLFFLLRRKTQLIRR